MRRKLISVRVTPAEEAVLGTWLAGQPIGLNPRPSTADALRAAIAALDASLKASPYGSAFPARHPVPRAPTTSEVPAPRDSVVVPTAFAPTPSPSDHASGDHISLAPYLPRRPTPTIHQPRPPRTDGTGPGAAWATGKRTSRLYTAWWKADSRQAQEGRLLFQTWGKLCGVPRSTVESHGKRSRHGDLPAQLSFERVRVKGGIELRYLTASQRAEWLSYWDRLGHVQRRPTEDEVLEALDELAG